MRLTSGKGLTGNLANSFFFLGFPLLLEFGAAVFTEFLTEHCCTAFWTLNSWWWIQGTPAMSTKLEILSVLAPTAQANDHRFGGSARRRHRLKHVWNKNKPQT
jgi:hypothetical protein